MNNKIKFKVPSNKNECRYIGFSEIDDNSVFMFPCQYLDETKISENEIDKIYKYEAKKIITLIKRVKKEYLLGGNNGELFQFYSMIWIIQDYINHGYYVETEIVSRNNTIGKINWKKTIKQNHIFFNNNNIVYKNFVRDMKIYDDSQIISQIYKACLRYSVQKLGFIFGIEKTQKSIFDIELKDKEFITYYLKNQLHNTFKDYKKNLVKNLLAIINTNSSENKNSGFSIYDNEFEYVFEFLVNKVFGTENVKDFYNNYSYYLPNSYAASKLRPDTIMKDEETKVIYIIDSKYYNFGYSEKLMDLPQSSSISKQIGYNHYLRDNLKGSGKKYKVKSVFLLPYSSEVNNEYIKYVGYAESDNNKENDDKIAICLIDLKELINSYLLGNNNLNSKTLINALSFKN